MINFFNRCRGSSFGKTPLFKAPQRGATEHVSSIPGGGIGVREKILDMPSVGVGGKTHVCRKKCTDWASWADRFGELFMEVMVPRAGSLLGRFASTKIGPLLS